MSTETSSGPQRPGLGAMALPRPSSGAIVTAEAYDGAAHRCGAGAFTLVSLDPPLALVTLPRSSAAAQCVGDAPFTVDVPDASGTEMTLTCSPWNVYDGGDHVIAVGEVVSCRKDQPCSSPS